MKTPLLVSTILLACAYFFHRHLYFRDYAIVWEGAYRISLGQIPYLDFGLPMGPLPFLLPALLFKVFGSSFNVLKVCALLLNVGALFGFLLFLREFTASRMTIWFGALGFTFIHAMHGKYIWYNTVASALCIIALGLFVRLMRTDTSVLSARGVFRRSFISAVMVFAVFLSKQDYGILSTFLLLGHLFLLFLFRRARKQSMLFLASLAFIFIVFIVFFKFTSLGYWFNLGQYPHTARADTFPFSHWLSEPSGIRVSLILVAGLGVVSLLRCNRRWSDLVFDKLLFFGPLFGLVLMSSITWFSSGLSFSTGLYGLSVVPAVICHGVQEAAPLLANTSRFKIGFFKSVLVFLMTVFVYDFRPQERPAFKDLQIYFEKAGVGDFVSHRVGSEVSLNEVGPFLKNVSQSVSAVSGSENEGLISGTEAGFRSFGNEYLKAGAWAQIRQFVQTFSAKLRTEELPSLKKVDDTDGIFGNSCKFLNISELSPLFAELGLVPCAGLPLWYHTGVSLFRAEQIRIMEGVANKKFLAVVVQQTHELGSGWYSRLISLLNQNYIKSGEFFAGANSDPVRVYFRP